MPFGDRTGPFGRGPRTGRALGFCGGFESPEAYFGRGRPWGFGRGWRRGFGGRGFGGLSVIEPSEQEEVQWLEQEAKGFERALRGIRSRIERLRSKSQTPGAEEEG
jgi:hypothetical protein